MQRSRLPYATAMNVIGYQAIWFGSILGRDALLPVLLALVLLHVYFCTQRAREVTVLVVCTALGFLCDSLWTLAGVFVFDPSPAFLPAPLWLAMIWLGFAATLRHGLRFAIERPGLGIALAAIGAPVSYIAAGTMGAVTLPLGTATTAGIIAGSWMVLMSLFIELVRRVDPKPE